MIFRFCGSARDNQVICFHSITTPYEHCVILDEENGFQNEYVDSYFYSRRDH